MCGGGVVGRGWVALSSRYAEVSLLKSLTPSVLPRKKGTRRKDSVI